jgi:hypothetical protein
MAAPVSWSPQTDLTRDQAALSRADSRPQPGNNTELPAEPAYRRLPQQFLYFLPEPQGHGSLRPIAGVDRLTG